MKVDCTLHGVVRDPLQYRERHVPFVVTGHTTQPISLILSLILWCALPFPYFNELLSNETLFSHKIEFEKE